MSRVRGRAASLPGKAAKKCLAPAKAWRTAKPGSRLPKRPADLEAHNCLVYTYRASRNDWRFLGPDGRDQMVQVTCNLEANDAEALSAALLGGLGLGLLPLWLVASDLRSGRLMELLNDYHAPDSAIYAVYPPGRHLSPKVRGFVDFLAASFARKEAWCAKE